MDKVLRLTTGPEHTPVIIRESAVTAILALDPPAIYLEGTQFRVHESMEEIDRQMRENAIRAIHDTAWPRKESAKGFVRPFRDAYKHLKCGAVTTMEKKIAETYARDPSYYSLIFCDRCAAYLPVGEGGEFVWYEMDGSIGPKVGT